MTVQVVVTAKNGGGEATRASTRTAVVAPLAPSVVEGPKIKGTAEDGEALTASEGTWKGTPTITFSYQWQICNSSGEACKAISGATASTYKLKPTEVGSTLRVIVTAENAAGKASATSEKTAVVVAAPPTNEKLPMIKGTAEDGETLTAETGTWKGTPTITYTYQWEICNGSGEACKNISGATSSTYKLTPTEVGSTLRVIVTAENAVGKASATSEKTAVVTLRTLTDEVPPSIKGTARDGETLTAETGTWKGTPTITFTYQWERCESSGNNCNNISGATSSTYKLKPTEVGSTLRVIVTAENPRRESPGDLRKDGGRGRGPAGQRKNAPVDQRHRQGRRNADGRNRHLEGHPDDHLRLPVAELQQSRRSVLLHPRGHLLDLQADPGRSRHDPARHGHGQERRRGSPGHLRTDRRRGGDPAVGPRRQRPLDLGRSQGRKDPHGRNRHLEGHPDDHLRLPVGDLQRLRGSLQNDLGRHLLDLQAHPDRSRLHAAGHRHRQERRRGNPGHLLGDRSRQGGSAHQRKAPLDLGHRQGRRNPDGRKRNLEGHPDDHLRLPVGDLQRLRGSLQKHLGRDLLDLQADIDRSRLDPARHRHDRKRRRESPGHLRKDGGRARGRARQRKNAPVDQRHRQGRRNPDGRNRHLEGHPDDHLHLPVAELQRLGRSLQNHLGRNLLDLQADPGRSRHHPARHGHGQERGRGSLGDL